MSPEKARVLVVEDNLPIQRLIGTRLKLGGHTVASTASNLKEALECAEKAPELRINVAIVDGNLGTSPRDCDDGRKVAERLRRVAPGVKIIACSASLNADYGDDYGGVKKDKEKQIREIGKIVTSL